MKQGPCVPRCSQRDRPRGRNASIEARTPSWNGCSRARCSWHWNSQEIGLEAVRYLINGFRPMSSHASGDAVLFGDGSGDLVRLIRAIDALEREGLPRHALI